MIQAKAHLLWAIHLNFDVNYQLTFKLFGIQENTLSIVSCE